MPLNSMLETYIMHCRSCKQYIKAGATKCKHCGSPQNWRRYFETPTFLIAFIASVIALAPTVIKVWRGDYVVIEASVVKSDQRGLSVLISNKVTLDAGVRRAYIKVFDDGGHIFDHHLDTIEWEKLEAKKSKLIVAKAKKGQVPIYADPKYLQDISLGNCALIIEFVSSLKDLDSVKENYPCYLATIGDGLDLK
jgi:hypothetical protein